MGDYDRDLATFYGADVRLVSHTAITGRTGSYTLHCRRDGHATAFDAQILLRHDRAGRVTAVTFDRALTLPGGVAVRANQPVPIETVMRAVQLARRTAERTRAGTLTVKSCGISTSLKKPEAEGFKGFKRLAGSAPTSFESFSSVHTFVVGLNISDYTNPTYHTFPCALEAVSGKDGEKYSSKFFLDNDPDNKYKVASFTAQIRNGVVSFVYKEWMINPNGEIVDQATYDQGRQDFENAKKGRYFGTAVATFSMDGEANTATDVPMLLRVGKYAASSKSVRAAPPQP
jgi:hypothetical protein